MESNIRNLRTERHLSQAELGEIIGLSQQIVSRMEKDRNTIRVQSLISLADYFEVSTDAILGYQVTTKNKFKIEDGQIEQENGQSIAEQTPQASQIQQSAVHELLKSVKRYLEECGI